MSTEKLLSKIQNSIQELAPMLELFVDDAVQPSAEDCEKLQLHLNRLQDILAVYKYKKQETEISPSFNIHAKLSEQESKGEQQNLIAEELKLAEKIEQAEKEDTIAPPVEIPVIPKAEPVSIPKSPLVVGVNDKFRFINELFSQNLQEYSIAMEQLSNLSNWNDTEIYLNSLKTLYAWKDNSESVKLLTQLARQRFQK